MATTRDFIEYLLDQVDDRWNKRYRRMFGEYMVYINDKPILLVCDNTVYAKMMDAVSTVLASAYRGFPYNGAKEHYIVDTDNKELLDVVITELVKVVPIPVKKTQASKIA